MPQFVDYAYYYNAFYKDKDYAKEARDVDLILKEYGDNVKDILVFGCGTGNHDEEFINLGYRCHGIDMSSGMINEARKKAEAKHLDIEYEVADIRNYEPRRKYDAVISLFHVMSYQTGNDDIKSAFRSARAALSKGGLLLFDAWYGPGVLTEPPEVRIKEVEDANNRLVRLCRPVIYDKKNTVDVNYEILVLDNESKSVSSIKETHRMRYFFYPEMEEYLCEEGFKLIKNMDCGALGETSFSSWTCYFVAEAI